jgi:hypothetical protein
VVHLQARAHPRLLAGSDGEGQICMSEVERVPIPRLHTRGSLLWVGGTGGVLLGVIIYLWIAQPGNRWATALGAAGLLGAALWLISLRTWVEPATGTVVRESFWTRRRRAGLASASSVSLVNNRGGALLLGVRHRRTMYVEILTLTGHVQRSQSPGVLRFLADQIDSHAPRAKRVAAQLRDQADFIARGGAAAQSPLVALITGKTIGAAPAGRGQE